jgi:hypothetical protein
VQPGFWAGCRFIAQAALSGGCRSPLDPPAIAGLQDAGAGGKGGLSNPAAIDLFVAISAPFLPLAYRAGDLMATVVQDAHPVSDDEVAAVYAIAASTMAMSCSVEPPLTPTPAITRSSLVRGTPPPIAEYLPPETARRG